MNGRVLGTTRLVDSGASSARWDLVLLGDGYASGEIANYERHVDEVVDGILSTAPFDELRPAINIHRVNVVSDQSGASDLCANIQRSTFFGAKFCDRGLQRLLTANVMTAVDVADDEVPQWNALLMVVNSDMYGGSGGAVPVFSAAPEALEIALHEMGHAHFRLADEYPYWSGCDETGRDRYTGSEPAEVNVTTNARGAKWNSRITGGVPLPTMQNPDCTRCDDRSSTFAPDVIGAFEGARYFKCGIYRPAHNCRMRNLGAPFCAVCQDAIRATLAPFKPRGKRRAVGK